MMDESCEINFVPSSPHVGQITNRKVASDSLRREPHIQEAPRGDDLRPLRLSSPNSTVTGKRSLPKNSHSSGLDSSDEENSEPGQKKARPSSPLEGNSPHLKEKVPVCSHEQVSWRTKERLSQKMDVTRDNHRRPGSPPKGHSTNIREIAPVSSHKPVSWKTKEKPSQNVDTTSDNHRDIWQPDARGLPVQVKKEASKSTTEASRVHSISVKKREKVTLKPSEESISSDDFAELSEPDHASPASDHRIDSINLQSRSSISPPGVGSVKGLVRGQVARPTKVTESLALSTEATPAHARSDPTDGSVERLDRRQVARPAKVTESTALSSESNSAHARSHQTDSSVERLDRRHVARPATLTESTVLSSETNSRSDQVDLGKGKQVVTKNGRVKSKVKGQRLGESSSRHIPERLGTVPPPAIDNTGQRSLSPIRNSSEDIGVGRRPQSPVFGSTKPRMERKHGFCKETSTISGVKSTQSSRKRDRNHLSRLESNEVYRGFQRHDANQDRNLSHGQRIALELALSRRKAPQTGSEKVRPARTDISGTGESRGSKVSPKNRTRGRSDERTKDKEFRSSCRYDRTLKPSPPSCVPGRGSDSQRKRTSRVSSADGLKAIASSVHARPSIGAVHKTCNKYEKESACRNNAGTGSRDMKQKAISDDSKVVRPHGKNNSGRTASGNFHLSDSDSELFSNRGGINGERRPRMSSPSSSPRYNKFLRKTSFRSGSDRTDEEAPALSRSDTSKYASQKGSSKSGLRLAGLNVPGARPWEPQGSGERSLSSRSTNHRRTDGSQNVTESYAGSADAHSRVGQLSRPSCEQDHGSDYSFESPGTKMETTFDSPPSERDPTWSPTLDGGGGRRAQRKPAKRENQQRRNAVTERASSPEFDTSRDDLFSDDSVVDSLNETNDTSGVETSRDIGRPRVDEEDMQTISSRTRRNSGGGRRDNSGGETFIRGISSPKVDEGMQRTRGSSGGERTDRGRNGHRPTKTQSSSWMSDGTSSPVLDVTSVESTDSYVTADSLTVDDINVGDTSEDDDLAIVGGFTTSPWADRRTASVTEIEDDDDVVLLEDESNHRTPSYSRRQRALSALGTTITPGTAAAIRQLEEDEAMALRLQLEFDQEETEDTTRPPQPQFQPYHQVSGVSHSFYSHGTFPHISITGSITDPSGVSINFSPGVVDWSPLQPRTRTARRRGRGARTRGHASRRIIDPEPDDYERLLELAEQVGPAVPQGLCPSILSQLPTFKYRQEGAAREEDRQCAICMSEYDDGEDLRRLPCFHAYHTRCIDQWFQNSSACPICREQVRLG